MSSEGKTIVLCTIGPLLSFVAVPPQTDSTVITSVAVPTARASSPGIPPAASPFYYDPPYHRDGDSCEARGRSRRRKSDGDASGRVLWGVRWSMAYEIVELVAVEDRKNDISSIRR
ncbi:hypothetical protein P171DRAFT_488375 [Karstenula rhodostoma CBS 690.94]|uniref:Uncharacterized protein n=1 Tax=Karstenula rhodostoma CBS 690.94 TaxID=1392251 RepID=A0A9P4PD66_9PLEO|nr:hypothetical protein P171DRAFT_488375 [Karstenula rhodostoma CBS 690.94]